MAGRGSRESQSGEGRGLIGSLTKGLQVLDLFSAEHRELSIGHMAEQLGIHRSSASRIAATLAMSGYLQQVNAPGTYRLGQRLAALGELAGRPAGLTDIIVPHLERLVEITGETGHLAVLRGPDTSTIAVVDGWHTVRMHSYVGKQAPAYVSSMGKALLAGLPESTLQDLFSAVDLLPRTERTIRTFDELEVDLRRLRERGYGVDDEELEQGLRCVSAPVFSPSGAVDASISISGPTQRITPERIPLIGERVRWHAWQASLARGATRTPEGWTEAPTAQPEEYVAR